MTVGIHTFEIKSISPLLMHNPASMLEPAPTGAAKKKIPSAEEEAAKYIYRVEGSDQLCFIPVAFRAALTKACTGKRIGKMAAKTVIQSGVFHLEEYCPLYHMKTRKPIKDYEIYVTRVVIQRQGIARARPRIRNWATKVVFEIDDDFTTPEVVAELLNLGGRMAGVGDWRVEKGGIYGRFSAEYLK